MKWNKYPETSPELNGYYVVRFADEVRGCRYGFRFYEKQRSGVTDFTKGDTDTTVTHWGIIEEFKTSAKTMKRPSDEKLVRQYLDGCTGADLAEIFVELFSVEDVKEILIKNMSESDYQAIADDEWDDYCFTNDCEREDQLWESGSYF